VRVHLDHGRSGIEVDLPDRTTVLESPHAPPVADPATAIRAALAAPIGARPLAEVARGRRSAVVVIADKTRPVPNGLLLPPILETIEAAGVPRERIEILVGTGLHRANTEDELVEMTSAELVARYRFRNHVARDPGEHRGLGKTTRGTEIWLDARYLDAELKIVTGLIEPHLMAGYSGGRKGICPALAGVETMRSLHGPAMLEDRIGPGIIEGNPFHEDLLEIASRAGCDFLANVSIDRVRRLTGVFAGDLVAAHAAGIASVERQVSATVDRPADVVVTSAGGYPLDQTLYQAIKGLVSALNVVRRGGTIILAAEIAEGIGSQEFVSLLAHLRGNDEFMGKITGPGFFVIDQWMAQHLCQVMRKARIVIAGAGNMRDASALGGLPIDVHATVEDAVAAALARHGADASIAAIPEGPYVLSTVRGRKLSLGRAWMDDAA
jgi:lactate racemase